MRPNLLIVTQEPPLGPPPIEKDLLAMLTAEQVQISTVNSFAVARLQVMRQPFDMVIATLGFDGEALSLIRDLRGLFPELPLVLLHDQTATLRQVQLAARLGAHVIDNDTSRQTIRMRIAHLLKLHLPAASPLNKEPSKWATSTSRVEAIRDQVKALGQNPGVEFALLADLNGQTIAAWHMQRGIDLAAFATMAAGELSATLELGNSLGAHRACNLIWQEYDNRMVLISRVSESYLLLLAIEVETLVGPIRLSLQRTVEQIQNLLNPGSLYKQQALIASAA